MADQYVDLVSGGLGKKLAQQLGLPAPVALRRFEPNDPLCESPVLVVGEGYADAVAEHLHRQQVTVVRDAAETEEKLGALILDASTLRTPAELGRLHELGATPVKRLGRNARVVVIGTDWDTLAEPAEVATQRALDGFTRSLAKELRAGATANLVLAPAEAVASTAHSVAHAVEFFCSGRSAFVDGQTVRIDENPFTANPSNSRRLQGKVAVVTGAARGIGAAIVGVLAREGAKVVGVDIPAAGEQLARVMNAAAGTALSLDVTRPEAGRQIVDHCRSRHGGLDIVVHNAGITRDKLFVNMDQARWESVLDVNLRSIIAMNEALLGDGGLGRGGRIVCLSSQSGFAGNRGQTNYSATKAAVIGLVDALADRVSDRGITVNAVAPGLIETEMTQKMPFANREIARRLSSLQQGGQPIDVAELITFLAEPASSAITGQTIRVCGQNMIGA